MEKILLIASDNNKVSGAFQSMTKLCSLINKSGRYKTMVVLPMKGDGAELLERYGVKYKYIRSYHWIVQHSETNAVKNIIKKIIKKCINVTSVLRIASFVKKNDIAIIHSNTSYVYVGQKAADLTGTRSIWHIRELLEEDQNCSFWSRNCIELMKKADVCVAISDCVREKYASNLKNIKVIYNGIDPEEYYCKRSFEDRKDKIVFLCIGNMSGGKGQDVILRASKMLLEDNIRNFEVRFVGSGVKEEEYKKLAHELGVEEVVEFCGRTNNAKAFYATSDAMLMSSKAEAFGRTTVEAMMSGCLVIGSNSGATPELIKNNEYGFLYKKEDHKDLYEKMRLAITDQKVFSLAKKGQQYAMENFTALKNSDSIMKLYDSILEKRKK